MEQYKSGRIQWDNMEPTYVWVTPTYDAVHHIKIPWTTNSLLSERHCRAIRKMNSDLELD